jgi:hypothetical protein
LVLAFEDPAGTARKILNRRLFPAQFTMASDASETTGGLRVEWSLEEFSVYASVVAA